MSRFDPDRRAAGILLPLFALRSGRDWGVGEMLDLPRFCAWLAAAGHRWLQLLLIFEVAPGERSPYGALSAFALDPVYLSLPAVEDFVAAGGVGALAAEDRASLAAMRTARDIDYDTIRRVKRRARARVPSPAPRGSRAAEFDRFRTPSRAGSRSTRFAPRRRARRATPSTGATPAGPHARGVEAARVRLLARRSSTSTCNGRPSSGRRRARARPASSPRAICRSPSGATARTCGRAREFALDRSLGAPPDAFSATARPGVRYRWRTMADGGFARLRRASRGRAQTPASTTWSVSIACTSSRRRHDAGFVPRPSGVSWCAGGDVRVLLEAANGAVGGETRGEAAVVRRSLTRLGIPGIALRWEDDASKFRDPVACPALRRSQPAARTHDRRAGNLVARRARRGRVARRESRAAGCARRAPSVPPRC
jgi:4-alpha-glucanotransferase